MHWLLIALQVSQDNVSEEKSMVVKASARLFFLLLLLFSLPFEIRRKILLMGFTSIKITGRWKEGREEGILLYLANFNWFNLVIRGKTAEYLKVSKTKPYENRNQDKNRCHQSETPWIFLKLYFTHQHLAKTWYHWHSFNNTIQNK